MIAVAVDGAALGIRQIHPDVAVALLARKTARVDAVALQLGIRRDRGNLAALSRVRVKAPAVIRALDGLPVARARRERKRAVRANVAQRERFSRGVAPEDERNFHAASKSPARARAIRRCAAPDTRSPTAIRRRCSTRSLREWKGFDSSSCAIAQPMIYRSPAQATPQR